MKNLTPALMAIVFAALGGIATQAQTVPGSQFNGLYLGPSQKEGVALAALSPGNVFDLGELHDGQAAKVIAVLSSTGCVNFLSGRTGQVGIETVCPQMDAAGNVMAMRLKSSGEEFLLQR
ncbi:hypothetical protein A2592_00595 [Candidatus Kaiserbacteria bacterium RIFOXYD1_FULL_42_15]|uniref:DUF5666 domain-containing protein n=1 Tax=Candidatus Kaiserbacteria bacterium RIFOXYD1_FULL_42_15 TaxID=1798532 RepID=A0A1F6FTJ5_9BACT|nr:MAG: hypothetical protein A2592_00595 [Candidatus Kaiserbacteria bacterium RIFOXYD1_FULL_42_15]